MMLGYPLFLMLLEKSIRDLNYGETVEFMGVTLTAAAVGFLIPVMFPDTGIRASASQVIDKIRDNQNDASLGIGRIKRVHKNDSLSDYANLLFALTLPAWFFQSYGALHLMRLYIGLAFQVHLLLDFQHISQQRHYQLQKIV